MSIGHDHRCHPFHELWPFLSKYLFPFHDIHGGRNRQGSSWRKGHRWAQWITWDPQGEEHAEEAMFYLKVKIPDVVHKRPLVDALDKGQHQMSRQALVPDRRIKSQPGNFRRISLFA